MGIYVDLRKGLDAQYVFLHRSGHRSGHAWTRHAWTRHAWTRAMAHTAGEHGLPELYSLLHGRWRTVSPAHAMTAQRFEA